MYGPSKGWQVTIDTSCLFFSEYTFSLQIWRVTDRQKNTSKAVSAPYPLKKLLPLNQFYVLEGLIYFSFFMSMPSCFQRCHLLSHTGSKSLRHHIHQRCDTWTDSTSHCNITCGFKSQLHPIETPFLVHSQFAHW